MRDVLVAAVDERVKLLRGGDDDEAAPSHVSRRQVAQMLQVDDRMALRHLDEAPLHAEANPAVELLDGQRVRRHDRIMPHLVDAVESDAEAIARRHARGVP